VGGLDETFAPVADVEIYNPSSDRFTRVASLSVGRYYHTATLLADGRVLVVGGYDASGLPIATAEIFNPSGNSVSADASTAIARVGHAATLLADGSVLVTGGISANSQTIYRSAERYVPAAGSGGAFVDAGHIG